MARHHDVLIIGSGHAGAQAGLALRQLGYQGSIGITGDDPHPPYERPPLSKEYLLGNRPFEKMLLRPSGYWADAGIELAADSHVTSVDPTSSVVESAGGGSQSYGTLVWASGGDSRRLDCEGHDLEGVHAIRTRSDVDKLLQELPQVARAVIVGGGFIGLEAASALTKLGKSVTLLEAQDRVLARVCGPQISEFYQGEHRARGVDLRTTSAVARIKSEDGCRVSAVELANGEEIACDVVIVGIGIVPAIEPLRKAGVDCGVAAIVDYHGRTSMKNIYAIGDCASRPSKFAVPPSMRIESVQNANVTALAAASDIVGIDAAPEPVPWFWSNQFDLKLQTAGINAGYDRTMVTGEPTKKTFAVVYFKGDRLLAVDCVNAPKLFAQAKKAIAGNGSLDW